VCQDLFSGPGWDGEEPDGSVPPPVTGNGPGAGNPGRPVAPGSGDEWPGDDPDAGAAAEQGLADPRRAHLRHYSHRACGVSRATMFAASGGEEALAVPI
jgi:hypothetical protein